MLIICLLLFDPFGNRRNLGGGNLRPGSQRGTQPHPVMSHSVRLLPLPVPVTHVRQLPSSHPASHRVYGSSSWAACTPRTQPSLQEEGL